MLQANTNPLRSERALTRAESSNYTQTSTYPDVLSFIEYLRTAQATLKSPPFSFGSIGKTFEGKDIPYIVVSRPMVRTHTEAKRTGRSIVYIQANIHAGEVEGKEAILALLRDLAWSPKPNILDSLVLFVVPIYNADGNDKFGLQEVTRPEQNGPVLVGTRANAQRLNLNRDYVKAQAPETLGFLKAFHAWQPDVFMDLHTTDGSYHGYVLTFSPALAPAAPSGVFTRDSLLPIIRQRMRERHHMETFSYGDFASQDTLEKGWFSFGAGARYSTNYAGLSNTIAILSEAYSHDPFEKRVASTRAFITEVLSYIAETGKHQFKISDSISIRSTITHSPVRQDVIAETLEKTGDNTLTQPGVPKGIRRTGKFITARIPVYDRFDAVMTVERPSGYIIPSDTVLLNMLYLHGIKVDTIADDTTATVETFIIDSVQFNQKPFEGHQLVSLTGKMIRNNQKIPKGSLFVSTSQRLGTLAVYLLEPQSEDGLVTWNLFDAYLKPNAEFPVKRVLKSDLN